MRKYTQNYILFKIFFSEVSSTKIIIYRKRKRHEEKKREFIVTSYLRSSDFYYLRGTNRRNCTVLILFY